MYNNNEGKLLENRETRVFYEKNNDRFVGTSQSKWAWRTKKKTLHFTQERICSLDIIQFEFQFMFRIEKKRKNGEKLW